MPLPAMPHHLDSLNVQSIVHLMFMAFLIMISVFCTFSWPSLKIYCEQNYICHNFTYLTAGWPLLLILFFCFPLSCFPFPCLKFVITYPVGMCFINMYSHTHNIRACLHEYVSYSAGQTFQIVFILSMSISFH